MMGGGRNLRAARTAEGRRGRVVLMFALLNILPLGAMVYAAWKWWRGELPVERLPQGLGTHLALTGAALALLFLFAGWSLPLVHAVVKRVETGLARRRRVMDGTAKGNPFRAALMMPLLAFLWVVAYPVRFLMIAASLALVLLVVLGGVRLFLPDFLADYVPTVMAARGK
jgi:hypothetical protein